MQPEFAAMPDLKSRFAQAATWDALKGAGRDDARQPYLDLANKLTG